MTLTDAYEYVTRAIEAEGEQRAEYGMGAVSLGYDGGEAMAHYEGYSTANDPEFKEAQALIAAANIERGLIRVRRWHPDDIPF